MLDIYVTRSNSTLCMANLNCAIYISLEWRLKLLGEGKLLEANHFLKVNGENGLCYLQAFLFLKMPFLGIFLFILRTLNYSLPIFILLKCNCMLYISGVFYLLILSGV